METVIVKKFDYYQYTVPITTKTKSENHMLLRLDPAFAYAKPPSS